LIEAARMPGGDTVHRLATLLAPELCGRALESVAVRGRALAGLAGLSVLSIRSEGKHLFVDLDDGSSLRSHLGLYGAWHRYRPDEPWLKPERQASLVLRTEGRVHVCFNAREVELLRTQGFRNLDLQRRLGPDLTRESPAPELLCLRAQGLLPPETLVVDLLLDQRVACGIGNVCKSEVLFLTCRSPRLQLADLGHDDWSDLYGTAARLLQSNLAGGPRATREVPDRQGPLWVYRRAGLPCLRCGAMVRRERLGRDPRSTYWCEVCQAVSAAAGLAPPR
jgi:endonuclease VIII